MALQEQTIFTEHGGFSYHMEWALAALPRQRLQQHLRELITTINRSDLVNALVAFGDRSWNLLSNHTNIEGLQSFRSIGASSSRFAPSTQRDLMIWLQSPRHDENFRVARAINTVLKRDAELRLELVGFPNFDNRDLNGFLFDAANPRAEDIAETALIASPAAIAGGSFVMTQQWQHELDAFGRLEVAEQERVMGRRKADGAELDRAVMPLDAHAMRAERNHAGNVNRIYSRSVPYGNVNENGLYLMAFSAQPSCFNELLERMYGLGPARGASDRFLNYSKPMTGSYWFAPSSAHLHQMID